MLVALLHRDLSPSFVESLRALPALFFVFAVIICSWTAAVARADEPRSLELQGNEVTEPEIRPSAFWLAAQLIPSGELAIGKSALRYGLRWQVTPLLYSFGINRKLSPWRKFVAEPLIRHSGSVEAHVSPGFFGGSGLAPFLRVGVRGYAPILHRGEYLSLSLGMSYQRSWQNRSFVKHAVALEAGAYILLGILGLQVSYVPGSNQTTPVMVALNFRYL